MYMYSTTMLYVSSQDGCKMFVPALELREDAAFTDQRGKFLNLADRHEPIVVTQLKYSHIPKATRTGVDAFVNDPVLRYTRQTPDYKGSNDAIGKAVGRALNRLVTALCIRTKIARTVNKGGSIVIATYAENSSEGRNRKPSDRFFDFVTESLFRDLQNSGTPMQRERSKEMMSKAEATVEEAIGDRAKDMLFVDLLATAPAEQGRGYGSAVLDSITKEADIQNRATWLHSSNVSNTEFYNSHGFVTVRTYLLGDKNPEWHEPPVIVSIMVREPRKPADTYQKCLA